MGNTIWVLKEGQDEDNWDHSLILRHEKALKRLAKQLNVRKLADFYDYSVLNEEFGGPDTAPRYADLPEVKHTLQALIAAVNEGDSRIPSPKEVVEELQDCLEKVIAAEKADCRVRLTIIP